MIKKMILNTYRLQDPNDIQLTSLIHGNRLLNAKIHSIDKLWKFWTASAIRDQLWWCNKDIELMLSNEIQNTELLEHYLFNDDSDDLIPSEDDWDDKTTSDQQNLPVSRPPESSMEIDDCIIVRKTPEASRSSEQESLERPHKRSRQASIQENRRPNRPSVPNRRYQWSAIEGLWGAQGGYSPRLGAKRVLKVGDCRQN